MCVALANSYMQQVTEKAIQVRRSAALSGAKYKVHACSMKVNY